MTIDQLNALPAREAADVLERCNGSRVWAERMLAMRPYRDSQSVAREGRRQSFGLSDAQWLEAFAHHPRIGDLAALRERFASTAEWVEGEQSGATSADEVTLMGLAQGNRAYERRFGYIFISCATGKTAIDMLNELRVRLTHRPADEFRVAREEHLKIAELRIAKLLDGRP